MPRGFNLPFRSPFELSVQTRHIHLYKANLRMNKQESLFLSLFLVLRLANTTTATTVSDALIDFVVRQAWSWPVCTTLCHRGFKLFSAAFSPSPSPVAPVLQRSLFFHVSAAIARDQVEVSCALAWQR